MGELAINGGVPVRNRPFAAWPAYGEAEERNLISVVRSGRWGGVGDAFDPSYEPMLPRAEKAFADLQQAAYCCSVVNGTVAITVALQAAGIRAGDEVIVPSYTFIATATAPLAYGVIPVFCDMEEDTLQLDPDKLEALITSRTKAIIAVHLAGAPADMTRIMAVADKHGLVVIEDAAQAVGAQWERRSVGAIAPIGTFSLQSGKNLNCGEGGMIVTNDPALWEVAWSICNVGRVPDGQWYQHERVGQNYRMTEFQAAIMLGQLERLPEQMERREQAAQRLNRELAAIKGIRLTAERVGVTRHARHLYMFKLTEEYAARIGKEEFIRMLMAEGIPLEYGYKPLNRNEAIIQAVKELQGTESMQQCPVSERLSDREVFWLRQDILLAGAEEMGDIAKALEKVLTSIERNPNSYYNKSK